MTLLKEYFLPRILQWMMVIFMGVTITFMIPRLSPINPIDQAMGRLTAFQNLSPEATVQLRESLQDLYGLDGSMLDQYINFWKRVIRGDLGPSFSSFPMTVNAMIRASVGWTIGLLGTTLIISWFLGLILGSLAAYNPRSLVIQGIRKSVDHHLSNSLLHCGLCAADDLHLLPADLPAGGRRQGNARLQHQLYRQPLPT